MAVFDLLGNENEVELLIEYSGKRSQLITPLTSILSLDLFFLPCGLRNPTLARVQVYSHVQTPPFTMGQAHSSLTMNQSRAIIFSCVFIAQLRVHLLPTPSTVTNSSSESLPQTQQCEALIHRNESRTRQKKAQRRRSEAQQRRDEALTRRDEALSRSHKASDPQEDDPEPPGEENQPTDGDADSQTATDGSKNDPVKSTEDTEREHGDPDSHKVKITWPGLRWTKSEDDVLGINVKKELDTFWRERWGDDPS